MPTAEEFAVANCLLSSALDELDQSGRISMRSPTPASSAEPSKTSSTMRWRRHGRTWMGWPHRSSRRSNCVNVVVSSARTTPTDYAAWHVTVNSDSDELVRVVGSYRSLDWGCSMVGLRVPVQINEVDPAMHELEFLRCEEEPIEDTEAAYGPSPFSDVTPPTVVAESGSPTSATSLAGSISTLRSPIRWAWKHH